MYPHPTVGQPSSVRPVLAHSAQPAPSKQVGDGMTGLQPAAKKPKREKGDVEEENDVLKAGYVLVSSCMSMPGFASGRLASYLALTPSSIGLWCQSGGGTERFAGHIGSWWGNIRCTHCPP